MKYLLLLFFFLSLPTFAQNVDDSEEDETFTSEHRALFYKDRYHMAVLPGENFDPQRVTHILIPGSAKTTESSQFFESALLRAIKYKELFPNNQVVFLTAPDVKNKKNEEVFERFNMNILKTVEEKFTGNALIKELSKFSKIASIDFYGHSSPWAIKLGRKNAALDPGSYFNSLKKISGKFTNYAYVTLNGCNAGFSIAPKMSKALGVPVSGALTGSLFEGLQDDGHWYKKPDRTASLRSTRNDISLESSRHCSEGVCWRMKPQRNNYSSYWGKFKEGGLSFYKMFCQFENEEKCLKSMALSLLSFPSVTKVNLQSSIEDYKEVVIDHLCSTNKNTAYYKKCREGLLENERKNNLVFQMHPGNALNCDFKSCNATVKCKKKLFSKKPKPGSCHLVTRPNPNSTTLMREYLAYIQGFKALTRQ